jgi:hypothetical protein
MKLTTDAAHIFGKQGANVRWRVAEILDKPLPCPRYVCSIIDAPLNSLEPLTHVLNVAN